MREIKFRAWLPVHGRMSYGHTIQEFIQMGPNSFNGNEVFMQYTGLKDKNGKEIYEGDVLANGTHINWVVIYDAASFKVKFPDPINTDRYELKRWMAESREVIGNIHDNPELLNNN